MPLPSARGTGARRPPSPPRGAPPPPSRPGDGPAPKPPPRSRYPQVERGVRIRDGAGDLAVSFAGPSEENVPALKRLNAVIFPTRYSDVVYRQVQLCGDVTQLAYAGGELIGAVACRVEAVLGRPGGPGGRLYVITVGVLAEHRSRGLGSLLLQRSLALAR